MRVIHKDTIGPDTRLPSDAVPLAVDLQHSAIQFWYHTNPEQQHATLRRQVHVVGTGHPIPEEALSPHGEFVGTVQQPPYVWHIFLGFAT